jgi:gliding motility-associated-like protein
MMRHVLLITLFFPLFLAAQENCFNGVDDDGDGLIDLNDVDDCVCLNGLNVGGDQSLIPNPSFEQTSCLPTSWSQLNCATGWQQATNPTSDYFNSQSYYPSIFPQPVPDGNGLTGAYAFPTWQEYLGSCLISPMLAGQQYSITFSIAATAANGVFSAVAPIFFGPIDITIFGRGNCVTFPVNTNGCPVPNGWVALGSVTYNPINTWSTVNITFTPPFNIATIILGSPCDLPADYQALNGFHPYFLFDNLQLGEDIEYEADLVRTGEFCTNDVMITAHPDTASGVYQWFYEGVALVGETDTILDVSGNGLLPGTYQFYYFVDDTTCVITPIELEPSQYPAPQLSINDNDGCAPHTVNFTNTTVAAMTASCSYIFGNGATSANCNASTTYTQPGVYSVTLSVTSPLGCTRDTTYVNAITVHEVPVAIFSADSLEGCIDLPVNFTDLSQGPAHTCAWTFGDGGTSNLQNPSHLYTQDGIWDVGLTVTTAAGCTHDTSFVAYIRSVDSPTMLLSVDTIQGCRPLTLQFSNDCDPADVATCAWSFSNGYSTTNCDPQVTFMDAGTYSVTFSVMSPLGCPGDTTVTDWITVHDLPQPDLLPFPENGCHPLEVNFQNTTDPFYTQTCFWTFGDGGTSDECDPTYTYMAAGIYDVGLTVISSQNCLGDTLFPQLITVYEHPVAGFTYLPQQTDVFQPEIHFTDTSSWDVVAWEWLFGDEGDLGTSILTNPSFTFPGEETGIYPVTLVVTNFNGCVDTVMVPVTIDGYTSAYVPNAFTPDGDGQNDLFFPYVKDIVHSKYRFTIYDRWGERIFETVDHRMGWDGSFKGRPAKQDVYVWQLELVSSVDGKRRTLLGHVSLLR